MSKANLNITTSINRREAATAIMVAAASAALAGTFIANEIDPVFAAIQNHAKAEGMYSAAVHALGDYEDNHRTPDGKLPNDATADALEREAERMSDAASQAALDLLATKPTTLAGAVAMLEHALDQDDALLGVQDEGRKPGHIYLIESVLDVVKAAARVQS